MNPDIVSSYLNFLLDMDSTTISVDHDRLMWQCTQNPAKADMNTDLVSAYFYFASNIDSTTDTVKHGKYSELCCKVCVTALTVNCIEVCHMLKAHYRTSQTHTHKLTLFFMILTLVSSYFIFASDIDSTTNTSNLCIFTPSTISVHKSHRRHLFIYIPLL